MLLIGSVTPKGLAKKAGKQYWTFGTMKDKEDRVIDMDGEIACLIGQLIDDNKEN